MPAIIGSMRRAATNPSVIAGLKCPEIRISAVTKIDNTRPCASATCSNAYGEFACAAAIIAALPTNTSANVPTNSETKWRSESRMRYPVRNKVDRVHCEAPGCASLHYPAEDQRGIDTAESKRVAEHVLHPVGMPCPRDVVKIARRIALCKVHGWRQPFAVYGEGADRGLYRSRCTQRMAVISLRSASLHGRGRFAEDLLDRHCLGWIVERRRAAVRIDVSDLGWRHLRVAQRHPHRASGLRSVRQRRRHVMRVVGRAITTDFRVDSRAA